MTNWWKNGSNGNGTSSTWWGGGNGNGGAGGTCRDDCGAYQNKCTFGCTNPLAPNYDPLAQCDDGSCDIITYDDCVVGPPPPPPPPYDCSNDPISCDGQTYVPDDNFEAYLEANGMGNGAMDDYVTTANICNITHLQTIMSLNISDLTGIEDFASLTHLWCQDNQLTSIDVSRLCYLERFHCEVNQLTSLDVSNNQFLRSFDCNNNLLTSLDVSYNHNMGNPGIFHVWSNPNLISINIGSVINLTPPNAINVLEFIAVNCHPNLVIHVGTAARVTQAQSLFTVANNRISPGTTFAI